MGCITYPIGFAIGFVLMFWGTPMVAEVFDIYWPWLIRYPVAIVGGVVGAVALDSSIRQANEDAIIRRAQLKQAEEYLAGKDRDPDES